MTDLWSLPGFDVQCLLGFGASGEVWRAREVASGELVALKRLRQGVDVHAVEALEREAAALQGLDTPHLVRLRRVVGAGADAVLVLDHAAGGSLATLLARRRVLDPGEVVTVAAPLAQALAEVHARGVVHGDVTPANVLLTGDGMPLLSDLGLARTVGEHRATVEGTAEYVDPAVVAGGVPDEAADVWALAAVCHAMLAGVPPHDGGSVEAVLGAAAAGERAPLGLLAPQAPRALVHAVEAALAPEPGVRPDAAEFATLLRRAHAAAPVRLTGPAAAPAAPARPTHMVRVAGAHAAPARRRAVPRRVRAGAALVPLVLVAAVTGWVSGRGAGAQGAALPAAASAPVVATAPATSPAAAPDPDWLQVLAGLDDARSRAFATGDAGALAEVYAPASAGLAADRALLEELVAIGRTAEGVRHELVSVHEVHRSADAARLRVVGRLTSYQLRADDGAVVGRAADRPETAWLADLVRTPQGWRLVEVRQES